MSTARIQHLLLQAASLLLGSFIWSERPVKEARKLMGNRLGLFSGAKVNQKELCSFVPLLMAEVWGQTELGF